MFFIIVSKTLITPTGKNSDIFKLFIYGSIGYVLLHHYLYSSEQTNALEYLKNYIYYILFFDLLTAVVLLKVFGKTQDSDLNTDNVDIMKKVRELQNAENINNSDDIFVSNDDDPKNKDDNVDKSSVAVKTDDKVADKGADKVVNNVADKVVDKGADKVMDKVMDKVVSDTELPIYVGDD